ncbi:MAG: DNA-3-methyladenine glycosylase 2, partial [Gaiellaceae bacterium]
RRPMRRRFELLPRAPFRLDLTVWALRRREQNRIDTWDGHTYRRALLVNGTPLELAVTQVERASAPRLEVFLAGPHAASSAESAVRSTLARLLGLDLDLSDFYAHSARDSALSELAERYKGVKPPRFPSIFECLLNAVACQQLSLAAGLTLLSRLAAIAGVPTGALHTFPRPTDILRLSRSAIRTLGFSERKAETILELARVASTGELKLKALEHLDDAAVAEALVRQRGIGSWSADYVLLRGLGRLHVFPQSDVGALNGLRSFLAAAGRGDDPRAALASWAPDAGLVYFHLLLRGLEQRATRSGSQHARGTVTDPVRGADDSAGDSTTSGLP